MTCCYTYKVGSKQVQDVGRERVELLIAGKSLKSGRVAQHHF